VQSPAGHLVNDALQASLHILLARRLREGLLGPGAVIIDNPNAYLADGIIRMQAAVDAGKGYRSLLGRFSLIYPQNS